MTIQQKKKLTKEVIRTLAFLCSKDDSLTAISISYGIMNNSPKLFETIIDQHKDNPESMERKFGTILINQIKQII